MSDLYPHQLEGVDFLSSADPARFLADEQGLGKTAQAITAMDAIGALRVAVICPAVARAVWRQEFDTWSMLQPTRIVRSYSELVRDRDKVAEIWRMNADVVVFDEAHYLKNGSSKRTHMAYGVRMAGGIAKRAKRTWLLSGTPTPNHPGEWWTHLASLRGERRSYPDFVRYFCYTRPSDYPPGWQVMGHRKDRLPELRSLLEGWVLRRRDSVLDLPPLRWGMLPVKPKRPVETDVPKALLRRIRKLIEREDPEALNVMKQHRGELAKVRHATGLAKARAVCEYVEQETLESAILFCVHRSVIDELESFFGPDAVSLHGGTSEADREEAVRRFQAGDARIFIGQIQAAGVALTLTRTNRVIFVESSWDPASMAQAAKRAHRIGQDRHVLVQSAYIPDSLDEAIERVLNRKARMVEAVLATTEAA